MPNAILCWLCPATDGQIQILSTLFFYTILSIPGFAFLFWLAFIQCTMRGTVILFELYYYLTINWGKAPLNQIHKYRVLLQIKLPLVYSLADGYRGIISELCQIDDHYLICLVSINHSVQLMVIIWCGYLLIMTLFLWHHHVVRCLMTNRDHHHRRLLTTDSDYPAFRSRINTHPRPQSRCEITRERMGSVSQISENELESAEERRHGYSLAGKFRRCLTIGHAWQSSYANSIELINLEVNYPLKLR